MAVDDDRFILASLQRSLRKQTELQVDIFNNPFEAIEHAKISRYDVFISDYMMPGLSGVEFLANIKSLQPDSVRIILSGQDDMDTVIRATEKAGLFCFISKPVQREELIETIHRALNRD